MKLKIQCDWCGKEFERDDWALEGKKHHFCCRQCLADFSNKSKNPDGYAELKDYTNMGRHLTELNRHLNPTRMTPETRKKLRESRLGTGEGKTYAKIYGRHEHRATAEKMMGRPLGADEIVHHIDCDRRNNQPDNLLVMTQSEHAKLHARLRRFWADSNFDEEDDGE